MAEVDLGETIAAAYQRYYNEAWLDQVRRFNQGQISVPAGLNWRAVLGQRVDKAARVRLKRFLAREGIAEGPGANVLVNRWLRDLTGTGTY